MKSPLKSKTLWFGLALILLGIMPDLQALLTDVAPEWMAGRGEAVIGVVIVLLRWVTTQPVGAEK